MGKSRHKNSNYQQTKKTPAKQKRNQLEILSFAVGIAGLVLAILSLLLDIDDKPSINVRWIAGFLLISSSVTGIIFSHHRYAKCVIPKKKIVQYGTYLIWGLVLVLGASFLMTASHLKTENKENTSQQLENDEQQLLMQAELYYNGEKYGSMIDLYSSETLRENPIVLNNLGYMYSKGIYFEQNFDMAIQYYENASKKGLNDALHNLISLKLHNCTTFQDVVDVLRTGYDSNEGGTFLFLSSILENSDLSKTQMTAQEQKMIRTKIESFFDADIETQAEILSASLGPWENKTTISDTVTYGGGNTFERYILIRSELVYTGLGISPVYMYTYAISTRTFLYDDLIQEYFVSVLGSE